MKFKMKLFLLCAAVAPFLMMTSSQQTGSRFGCVCAFEKGNSNEPNESAAPAAAAESFDKVPPAPTTELFDKVPPDVFWDRFNQNKEILKQYASDNNTIDYYYFERIVRWLAEDKGVFIERFKNKLEKKAVDWLDFCFLSAILEGLLAARDQNFESMEPYFKKEFSKGFPFAELKKLTCSMWTQIKSIGFRFRLNGFYHSLIYLMHCRESEFFYFIVCLANFCSPYMQLFIACLMNFAYSRNTDVDWSALINIMNKHPDRLYSVFVVNSILSCFNFESKFKKILRKYYSSVFLKKDASSADILAKLAYLSSRNFLKNSDVQKIQSSDFLTLWNAPIHPPIK